MSRLLKDDVVAALMGLLKPSGGIRSDPPAPLSLLPERCPNLLGLISENSSYSSITQQEQLQKFEEILKQVTIGSQNPNVHSAGDLLGLNDLTVGQMKAELSKYNARRSDGPKLFNRYGVEVRKVLAVRHHGLTITSLKTKSKGVEYTREEKFIRDLVDELYVYLDKDEAGDSGNILDEKPCDETLPQMSKSPDVTPAGNFQSELPALLAVEVGRSVEGGSLGAPGEGAKVSAQPFAVKKTFYEWLMSHKKILAVAVALVLAASAGLIALDPFGASIDDFIRADQTSVDFIIGQATSPSAIVPKSLSDLDRPPTIAASESLKAWMVSHQAVLVDEMSVSFVARSSKVEPTIISSARVVVLRREDPLSGTWLDSQQSGSQSLRILRADLDAEPIKTVNSLGWNFPLKISRTDPEAFSVTVRTKGCHCFWKIELDALLPDGTNAKILVDDNGKPFEVTGSAAASEKSHFPQTANDPWP